VSKQRGIKRFAVVRTAANDDFARTERCRLRIKNL
jgi:hypothetical protein